ncbi:MAG: DMSO/selenate family reductase complex B subunit [Desulfosarcina sp.]
MIDHPAFFLDLQRCTGCKTCVIACRDKNDLGPGIRWRRVVEFCGGSWQRRTDGSVVQDVFAYYLSMSCNHCRDPICVAACPTTAMHQEADGIVLVDPAKCVGCRYCQWVCPYSAPQFDAATGRVSKCDFCREELQNGGSPACVAACPTRALHVGNYEELAEKYGSAALVAPLPPKELTQPSLILESHKDAQPLDSHRGQIVNPEEVRNA